MKGAMTRYEEDIVKLKWRVRRLDAAGWTVVAHRPRTGGAWQAVKNMPRLEIPEVRRGVAAGIMVSANRMNGDRVELVVQPTQQALAD